MRLLFVCLGNICRSPTAEGVMRSLVAEAGLENDFYIDSAGTGGWHVGSPPDRRAAAAARARGLELQGAARQVGPGDFSDFDLLLAMDSANARELKRMAPGPEERAKVRLLREFDPAAVADNPVDATRPQPGCRDPAVADGRPGQRDPAATRLSRPGRRGRTTRPARPGRRGRLADGSRTVGDLDVPDPYYGAEGGFDEVFELVRAACKGLLDGVRQSAAK